MIELVSALSVINVERQTMFLIMPLDNLDARFADNKTELLFVSNHLFTTLSMRVAPPHVIKNRSNRPAIRQAIRLTQNAVHKKQLSNPKLSTALFVLSLYMSPNGPSENVKVSVIA